MLEPTIDRVLIRLIKEQEDGLVIPEGLRDSRKNVRAEVHATGPGVRSDTGALIPLQVKVGDIVIVSPNAAGTIEGVILDGVEYGAIREHMLIGVDREATDARAKGMD